MGFSVGDKVIHPKFGAGRITGEEHRELVAGFAHYYVIEIIKTGATAYVPIQKMDELNVRLAMSGRKLGQVLRTLRSLPRMLSNDYKQRQERVQEKLGTRRPVLMAEAVRDLTWRKEQKRLTQKDETLLSYGRELLVSEIALATDAGIPAAQDMIDAALSVSVTIGTDELEHAQKLEGALAPATAIHVQAKA